MVLGSGRARSLELLPLLGTGAEEDWQLPWHSHAHWEAPAHCEHPNHPFPVYKSLAFTAAKLSATNARTDPRAPALSTQHVTIQVPFTEGTLRQDTKP